MWIVWGLFACAVTAPPVPEKVAVVERVPAPLPDGWLERVVGADDAESALPMVVMVHGLGDRPESMLAVLGDLGGPVRIVAPRAPDAWHDGWSWFPTRASGDEAVLAGQMAAVADAFVADLARVQTMRPTVGKPVLAGFSQGGMLSFTVAVRHPTAIAAAVPVAGWLPEPLWPEGGPPEGAPTIHALHGLDDAVLPFARTAEGVEALRSRGWGASMQAFPGVAHRIPAPVRAALYGEVASAIAAQ